MTPGAFLICKAMNNSRFERDAFNAYQNFLYKRAMFGLGVYSPEELEKMNPDKKKRIQKVHLRCQHVLNIWKQQICNQFTNNLLRTFFPTRDEAKLFFVKHENSVDPMFTNTLNFKDLGIKKEHIVYKLVQEGVLPRNFYSLKPDDKGEKKVV